MWDDYPNDYREREVRRILGAARAGESVSVVGLSGAGKSNLLGFTAHRAGADGATSFVLVDSNRLPSPSGDALFGLMRRELNAPDPAPPPGPSLDALDAAIAAWQARNPARQLCFALDRFDTFAAHADNALFSNLRALRDAHKYRLSFLTATRHRLDAKTEFAELIFANTLWLGCLSESDASWNVRRFAARKEAKWDDATAAWLIAISRGYPSFLRASCEALIDVGERDENAVLDHPAVRARVGEFWSDQPNDEEIRLSGLAGLPMLFRARPATFDTSNLTAKEHALLAYLQSRAGQVCDKDDIIRAVWSEDKAFDKGIRDDSLSQLVRRLREKIEPDANAPRWVLTVPGRGYRFAQ